MTGGFIMAPYACPSCKNRSRFYLVEQHPVAVKLHPQTGELLQQIDHNDPFLLPYRGDDLRIQCGVCGVVENETTFSKTAERV